MSAEEEMKAAFEGPGLSELGTTFKIRNHEHPCVMSTNKTTADLEEGGFLAKASFEIHVLKSEFDGKDDPKEGELVEIGGKTYIIESVETSEGDPCFALTCKGKDK